jgi:hypothetical protein
VYDIGIKGKWEENGLGMRVPTVEAERDAGMTGELRKVCNRDHSNMALRKGGNQLKYKRDKELH